MPEAADEVEPRVIAVPSDRCWFDPRLLNTATYPRLSQYSIAGGQSVQIAKADPSRLMIGFVAAGGAFLPTLAPWPDVSAYAWFNPGVATGLVWYKLFDYGPIICNSWWANSGGAASFRVVEILRTG